MIAGEARIPVNLKAWLAVVRDYTLDLDPDVERITAEARRSYAMLVSRCQIAMPISAGWSIHDHSHSTARGGSRVEAHWRSMKPA